MCTQRGSVRLRWYRFVSTFVVDSAATIYWDIRIIEMDTLMLVALEIQLGI